MNHLDRWDFVLVSPRIYEKTATFNKKSRDDLNDLYKNNQKLIDEIKYFVGDKTGFINETYLDKKFKHKT